MSTRAEVVEEGAKVSRIIMWLLYWCIKPETSKINLTKTFSCHCKSPNIFHVSRVSHGNFRQPNHYSAVLKICILGPLLTMFITECTIDSGLLGDSHSSHTMHDYWINAPSSINHYHNIQHMEHLWQVQAVLLKLWDGLACIWVNSHEEAAHYKHCLASLWSVSYQV